MKLTNQEIWVGQSVTVKLLSSLAYMVFPISDLPEPKICDHISGTLIIISHLICHVYITFLEDILMVAHSRPVLA